MIATATSTRRPTAASEHLPDRPLAAFDPLDDDRDDDQKIVATQRALCRVATVAAEAGARFQREGVGVDPMAWMLAPRRLFGGLPPIQACLERDAFVRGVIVHGLSLDLDMDAEEVDELLGDAVQPAPAGIRPIDEAVLAVDPADPGDRRQRLFTATVVAHDGVGTVHAFHASLAVDEAEIERRLSLRMGSAAADAVIVDGFDPSEPLVSALVAPALCDTLTLIAADPGSPLAAGLDLNVEQRFLN